MKVEGCERVERVAGTSIVSVTYDPARTSREELVKALDATGDFKVRVLE